MIIVSLDVEASCASRLLFPRSVKLQAMNTLDNVGPIVRRPTFKNRTYNMHIMHVIDGTWFLATYATGFECVHFSL